MEIKSGQVVVYLFCQGRGVKTPGILQVEEVHNGIIKGKFGLGQVPGTISYNWIVIHHIETLSSFEEAVNKIKGEKYDLST